MHACSPERHDLLQTDQLPAIEFDALDSLDHLIDEGSHLVVDLSSSSEHVPDVVLSSHVLNPSKNHENNRCQKRNPTEFYDQDDGQGDYNNRDRHDSVDEEDQRAHLHSIT